MFEVKLKWKTSLIGQNQTNFQGMRLMKASERGGKWEKEDMSVSDISWIHCLNTGLNCRYRIWEREKEKENESSYLKSSTEPTSEA